MSGASPLPPPSHGDGDENHRDPTGEPTRGERADSPPRPLDEERIQEIADGFLEALRAGERPDRRGLTDAHPEMAPWLDARLNLVEVMFDVGRSGSGASRVRCPYCGHHAALADTPSDAHAVCSGCGGSFKVAAGVPAPRDAERPTRIGRFEVLGLLGRGAFGSVYRARDPELDRTVAIKVPRAGHFGAPHEEERFLREARSAGRLKHPSIVRIHEIGYAEGAPYIVSDCVEGQTLAEKISKDRPSFRRSAELCIQIAEALGHAHREKVVHRDVKPQNILIDLSGLAHVTDFGLARRDEGEVTVTLDGQILGTPAYMSPEQAAGDQHRVDARSDVYSLGVVLYELLTGERPFRGSKSMLIHQVLHDEPRPPRSLNDRIPIDLETICLKAMAKESSRRYTTAGALAGDLGRFLAGEPIRARPVGKSERLWRWARRKPAVAALSAAVVLLLVSIAGVSATAVFHVVKARDAADTNAGNERSAREEATKALARSEERLVRLSVANGTRLLDEGDLTGALVWFTEALRLDRSGKLGERAHRTRIGTLLAHSPRLGRVWFHPAGVRQAAWSPDGRLIVAVSGSSASVLLVATGQTTASLEGHTGPIQRAAWSPDSSRVLTASADSTARVWDAATGKLLFAPLTHTAGLSDAIFSPDGAYIATASSDRTARIWNGSTGESISVLQHGNTVNRALFSPDGSRLVTSSTGATARVWEAATGKLIASMRHRNSIAYAEFSPDGTRIVTASLDGFAQVWDAASGEAIGPPLPHVLAAIHAAFSPDGRRVATASYALTARVWDASTGEPITPPFRSRSYLANVAFRPDGRLLLSASTDGTARLWSTVSGEQAGPALQHARSVHSAAFSPSGSEILTASDDGTTRLWDVAKGQPLLRPLKHLAAVSSASFSLDGSLLVTASDDGTAQIWKTASGEKAGPPLRHRPQVLSAEFSSDGGRVLTVSTDCARLWEVSGDEILSFRMARETRSGVLSPDGALVAATGADGAVQIWDASTGTVICSPLKHGQESRTAAFSSDSRLLVTGSHDRTAQVWDARTGAPVGGRMMHKQPIFFVAFSPDGLRVATACGDGSARVWDALSGEAVTPPLQHILRVERVSFAPDGRHVLTASFDMTAQVWEVSTGKPSSPRLAHEQMLRAAVFSPDGALAATASEDGTARVWDWRTGEPVTPPLRHAARVANVRFSPSGLQVLTSSQDGTAKLWDIRSDERPVEDLVLLSSVLSGRKIASTGSLVIVEADEFRSAWKDLETRHPEDESPGGEHVLAWHHREAIDAEIASAWDAAIWHLDHLPAAIRESPDVRLRRARAHAALGSWEMAEADYGRTMGSGEDDERVTLEHALVCLKSGNTDGYRKVCERLVERLEGSEDPVALNAAVWTCVLGPAGLRDPDIAVRAARKAVSLKPATHSYRNTLGAALYRAGDAEGSIRALNEGIRLEGKGGSAWDWVLLSMASRRAARPAEAETWLGKVTDWIDEVSRKSPAKVGGPQQPLEWKARAELLLLFEEARGPQR